MRLITLVAISLTFGWSPLAAAEAPSRRVWKVEEVTREGLIYAPPGAKSTACPVVFAFHGHGGTMLHASRTFAYHTLWPEAIVVYLQGLPTPGMTDPEGKKPGWQKAIGDQNDRDLTFFDTVLKSLKTDFQVDEKRIYATGHSNGGGFTYLLWAARGETFAALAPSAGGLGRSFRGLTPKPALHVAGEMDEIVAFANQKRSMDFVKTLNNCDAVGTPWAKSGALVGTLYLSKNGNPFVSVIYPGGHKFPAEAPALIVKFFQEYPATTL